MSIKDSLPTPYVTDAEVDVLFPEGIWNTTTSEDIKDESRGWARVYFDKVYICITIDLDNTAVTDIPADIKLANALLATYHLDEDIFSRNSSIKNVIEKEIKVTGLSTRKRYRQNFVDPFPTVTALIQESCRLNVGVGVRSVLRA